MELQLYMNLSPLLHPWPWALGYLRRQEYSKALFPAVLWMRPTKLTCVKRIDVWYSVSFSAWNLLINTTTQAESLFLRF